MSHQCRHAELEAARGCLQRAAADYGGPFATAADNQRLEDAARRFVAAEVARHRDDTLTCEITLTLTSGGSVRVAVACDMHTLSPADRVFVIGLLDQMAQYKRREQPPKATPVEPDTLTAALREYAWLSESNTPGRVGHTAEAWDAVAARIEARLAEVPGLTADQRNGAMGRARDARANASMLRDRARRAPQQVEPPTCDWRPFSDAEHDRPYGPRCGAAATHRIVALDGSKRFSLACRDHCEIDADATPHRVEELTAEPQP